MAASISVYFGQDRDVSEEYIGFKRYLFASSPKERARQLSLMPYTEGQIGVGVFDGGEVYLKRTADVFKLYDMECLFDDIVDRRGLIPADIGCVDVVFDFNEEVPESLDTACEIVLLTLASWATMNNVVIAFGLHLVQMASDGTLEPPHMHILWQRDGMLPSSLVRTLKQAFVATS